MKPLGEVTMLQHHADDTQLYLRILLDPKEMVDTLKKVSGGSNEMNEGK